MISQLIYNLDKYVLSDKIGDLAGPRFKYEAKQLYEDDSKEKQSKQVHPVVKNRQRWCLKYENKLNNLIRLEYWRCWCCRQSKLTCSSQWSEEVIEADCPIRSKSWASTNILSSLGGTWADSSAHLTRSHSRVALSRILGWSVRCTN